MARICHPRAHICHPRAHICHPRAKTRGSRHTMLDPRVKHEDDTVVEVQGRLIKILRQTIFSKISL